jgi:hypothetical protein
MIPYSVKKTISEEGVLLLEGLPYHTGEIVKVFILPQQEEVNNARVSLKGTVIYYDQPFAPVDVDEWETLQ